MTSRSLLNLTILGSCLVLPVLWAQDESAATKIGEGRATQGGEVEQKKEPVSVDKAKIRRTTVFDETEIRKLYRQSKAQNEKMNEDLPAHLNSEEMEIVTLKPLNVGGDELKLQRDLIEVLDPKPRRRLQRIAELDPEAANEMLVTMRNDQEFMSGQYDHPMAAGDPGRSADFTGAQIAGAFDKLISTLQSSRAKRQKAAEAQAEAQAIEK